MKHALVSGVVLLALASAASGCVDDRTHQVAEPVFYARNVKAYAETAKGLPPDVVYGWDLTVTSEAARWRECPSVDACGRAERSRPAKDLLGVEHAADLDVDGTKVEVLKLSLSPRPTYVVPPVSPGSKPPRW
jgi:hypothetical protein